MPDPFADDEWSGANVPTLRVTLRIRGDTLDPDFVTQLLGVRPTFSAAMGASAADDGAELETGLWSYRLDAPEDTELGSALDTLLALFPDDSTMWEELASSFAVDVHCVLSLQSSAQRTELDAAVLAALGRRGLPLTLELLAP